ncbi:hypothetical protein L1987_50333 [Smallanthus sonchifolius]|uniref:Uncharacterized protein n=2 Tax=Smallanthus sonchifolius TaxID=185202 RepID=A0ACB9ENB5_9ASTR|nr:hypothetical protein L1987_50329 [Smallanthus sonchifolius]KAI3759946.1 hypothetical protein L1987_50333 [Smallanthus sonchifolius]
MLPIMNSIDDPSGDIESAGQTKRPDNNQVLTNSQEHDPIQIANGNESLPVFDKESGNITEERKQPVNLTISFNNRNKLSSVTYDDLNITVFYLDPRLNTSLYLASTIEPGLYVDNANPNEVNVRLAAPGMAGLLQLQEELNTTLGVRVNLDYTAGFHCRSVCKHKHRFHNISVDIY